ncbi:MAG: 6,7-dimethyl-8-ribityllumazine synthase [Candidatus Margulisbacteria bacterium]|nr:6,7-dimethyl-8-ribityllumazine synthase [Candidatus Margulisiibacteriota bacterium]
MKDLKIAIVVSKFNDDITSQLLSDATNTLKKAEILDNHILIYHVPGAFEIPFVAQVVSEKKEVDAIICLGSVIRGETTHYDYVAGECARGIMNVSLQYQIPVIMGVLTTENRDQAQKRTFGPKGQKGIESANAALEMITLLKKLS